MADEISIGDVVQLRSGGCKMTVTEICQSRDNPDQLLAECNWFEANDSGGQKREWTAFPIAALRKIDD